VDQIVSSKPDTKSTAVSILEAFLRMKGRSIAQEFVREAEGVDVRAFVVGDKVVAAMKRVAQKGEFRSNLHRGGSGEIVKLDPEETKLSIQATKILGPNVAGVDFLRSKSGPKIIEVNASPGLEGIETTTNIQVARSIITFVERNAKYI